MAKADRPGIPTVVYDRSHMLSSFGVNFKYRLVPLAHEQVIAIGSKRNRRCIVLGALVHLTQPDATMVIPPSSEGSGDPHDLKRFVDAQKDDYDKALSEIRSGRKRSHWMWYIFPQYDGLGFSSTSKQYAIKSASEATAYLRHPVLGPRLVEICEAVLEVEGRTAAEIFGSPDYMKLRSCATLFAAASPTGSVFERVLDKYFQGNRDVRTLELMK